MGMCEKMTSPNQVEAPSDIRKGAGLSIIAALLGPPLVIFLAGFLTIQLELSQVGAPLLDLNMRPVPVTGEWVPYVMRAGLVLLAFAAVLGYRSLSRTWAGRVITLLVLVTAAFVGAYTLRPVPADGEPHPIALASFMYGAVSPFTLALIGAVIADMVFALRRRRANLK
ncbi:thiol:disulfide interchange protein [Arthrobacter globiformis]|nr:thiol:disulfide interchange protein [Arthrobacter globiformis]